jgi:hypothetical protein
MIEKNFFQKYSFIFWFNDLFVLAGTGWKWCLLSTMEREAASLLRAMEETIHKSYNYAIFESDSKFNIIVANILLMFSCFCKL